MTLPATFWAKVAKGCDCDHGCWIWTGAHNSRGYGQFGVNGTSRSVHRLVVEDEHGPIPDGMAVDHVYDRGCRHLDCVRPDHLEVVTQAENNRRSRVARGYHIGGHCGKGHELTEENVYRHPRGSLVCRTCNYEAKERPGAPIREWARANGFPVKDRGRLSPALVAAYESAQRGAAA